MRYDELRARLQAELGDRYVIERELGEGGMAIVYLAEDVRHERQVALKVMKPELATSIGGDRFLREVKIEAKLSHPHILPLYDSGEAAGLLYYVMPFVEGESLRDLLDREKQLSLDEALRIVREVAEALAHAHAYGIVHRDIKPENILLSGGHAVVADFGIARAFSAAGGENLTQTGMAVGTPAYMSPEQAGGDPNIDGRSDIYSLGCVLYEALVGQVPFTGPTPQAVMARHTMDSVPLPHVVRDTVSDELEGVILCALAKIPADRFRTASEMADALGAILTGSQVRLPTATRTRPVPHAPKPPLPRWVPLALAVLAVAAVATGVSIWQPWNRRTAQPTNGPRLPPANLAVLYFDDLSPDHRLGHVVDGVTEGLINQLSRVRGLNVVSRNGVAPFRGTDVALDSIAGQLSTGSVVEGAIEPVGGDLRVTVRLVDGNSGADYPDGRSGFTLPAAQLLAAQDSLVEQVARILRRVLGQEVRIVERRSTARSVEAWSLVQQGERMRKDGEDLVRQGDMPGAVAVLGRADSVLTLSERADPQWVDPVVLRAAGALRRARLATERREALDRIDVAIAHADRALRMDPNNAMAMEVRGSANYFHWYRFRPADRVEADALFALARRDLEAAVEVDGGLASAHSELSHLYGQAGENTSSLLEARRAYEEDAYLEYADRILVNLFWGSYRLEQHTQGRDWCREGQRRFPDNPNFAECELWLMTTDALEPNPGRAWQLADRVVALTPDPARKGYARHRADIVVGGVLALAGLADSARHVLLAARASPSVDPTRDLLYNEAYMRVLLHDDDEAIDLMKQYFAANPEEDHGGGESGELFWWWRELKNHPRFKELQR
ncbi:MAG: protein kinase [Gemmatimonadales bacterium]|nr:protein kinase [Gemmatimonadales bacterium]